MSGYQMMWPVLPCNLDKASRLWLDFTLYCSGGCGGSALSTATRDLDSAPLSPLSPLFNQDVAAQRYGRMRYERGYKTSICRGLESWTRLWTSCVSILSGADDSIVQNIVGGREGSLSG